MRASYDADPPSVKRGRRLRLPARPSRG